MDIELARTFVEIVSTGSFIKAADRLHVAQTTVSARVRLLEQQLGRPLFVRNKGGASLTPAGEQFLRFAPTFVQLWQRARQQVAVPEGHRAVLTVGSEVSLWQPLLVEWVRTMRRSHPGHSASRSCRRPSRFDHACCRRTCGHRDHVRSPTSTGAGNRLIDGGRARTRNNRSHDLSSKRSAVRSRRMGSRFFSSPRVSFPETVPSLVANLGRLPSVMFSWREVWLLPYACGSAVSGRESSILFRARLASRFRSMPFTRRMLIPPHWMRRSPRCVRLQASKSNPTHRTSGEFPGELFGQGVRRRICWTSYRWRYRPRFASNSLCGDPLARTSRTARLRSLPCSVQQIDCPGPRPIRAVPIGLKTEIRSLPPASSGRTRRARRTCGFACSTNFTLHPNLTTEFEATLSGMMSARSIS